MRFVITHKLRCAVLVRYDRIWALVDETGKKKSYLSKRMGHSERYLIDARKQNTNIKSNELEILAAELGTTVQYLIGEDDEKSIKKEAAKTSDLSEAELQLIELFRKLPAEAQETFPALLEATLKAQGLL